MGSLHQRVVMSRYHPATLHNANVARTCYNIAAKGYDKSMLTRLVDFISNLFAPKPVHLAIVRKYQDAQGNNVGELYMEQVIKRKHDELQGYTMIGVSLDSFSLDLLGLYEGASDWLDTEHDFLAPMPPNMIRVGALDPKDNDEVRHMIAKLPKRAMRVVVQNRFIERILEQP